jgi:hypothetical protein
MPALGAGIRAMKEQTAAPLHAPVGIFIVKNNRETMAARFCNRR